MAGTTALIERYLPQVDEFFGGRYPYSYLNVEVNVDVDVDFSQGPNIALNTRDKERASVVVHEIAHVYDTFGGPVWFVEGIAEVVTSRLTDNSSSGYARAANGAKVHLDARGGLMRDGLTITIGEYNAEAGNGALLLQEIANTIGDDRFRAAVQEILRARRTGRQILDIFMEQAPADKKGELQAVFDARVEYR
jgi:hypothetical protein